MFQTELKLRVRYAETDQMGFVYYGNYATYFEVARVEALRSLGVNYSQLEQDPGILMPVLDLHINYKKPAKYDNQITIKLSVKDKPGIKIKFDYEITGPNGTLLCTGYTHLAFINKTTHRPVMCPEAIGQVLNPHFDKI